MDFNSCAYMADILMLQIKYQCNDMYQNKIFINVHKCIENLKMASVVENDMRKAWYEL